MPRNGSVDHMGTVCLNTKELPGYFSECGSHVYIPMQYIKFLIPLVSHQYLKRFTICLEGEGVFALRIHCQI